MTLQEHAADVLGRTLDYAQWSGTHITGESLAQALADAGLLPTDTEHDWQFVDPFINGGAYELRHRTRHCTPWRETEEA